MAYYGRLPYAQRLEHKEKQAWYHTDDTCGSSFHGLAYTLQEYAKNDDLTSVLAQIDRCINARQAEMRARTNPDPAHNAAVVTLIDLRNKILRIIRFHHFYSPGLPSTIITYSDSTGRFSIEVGGLSVGGFKNKNKKRGSLKRLSKKSKKNIKSRKMTKTRRNK